MTISKGIQHMIDHVVWCGECNSTFSKIQIHMIKTYKDKCQYCKKATIKGLCKKHYDWVFPDE